MERVCCCLVAGNRHDECVADDVAVVEFERRVAAAVFAGIFAVFGLHELAHDVHAVPRGATALGFFDLVVKELVHVPDVVDLGFVSLLRELEG